MANPYTAWNVNQTLAEDASSDDILAYLVRFGVLAPSAHNTQPWHFIIQDGQLELHLDATRELGVSDPTRRELFLSLGAALANLEAAGAGIGRELAVEYRLHGSLVAVMRLGTATLPHPETLQTMQARRSNRNAYATEPLEAGLAQELASLAVGSAKIKFCQMAAEKNTVAELTAKGSEASLSRPEFRRELVGWVRNNWTKQFDGMPGFVQNIPGPVSLMAKFIMPRTNIGPQQAKTDRAAMVASQAIAIVTVPQDDEPHWLDAGRLFERLWLAATARDLAASSIASAIEVPECASELKATLTLTDVPVAILRLGKAIKPARHSPRRPAEMVLARH